MNPTKNVRSRNTYKILIFIDFLFGNYIYNDSFCLLGNQDRLASMNSVFRTIDLTCLTATPILAGLFFTYVNYGRMSYALVISVAEPAGEHELSISYDRSDLSHHHSYTRGTLLHLPVRQLR
jgi:hypothetical protein